MVRITRISQAEKYPHDGNHHNELYKSKAFILAHNREYNLYKKKSRLINRHFFSLF